MLLSRQTKSGTNTAVPINGRKNRHCHHDKGKSNKRARGKASVLLKMSAVKTTSSLLHLLVLLLTTEPNNNSVEVYNLNANYNIVCHHQKPATVNAKSYPKAIIFVSIIQNPLKSNRILLHIDSIDFEEGKIQL